MKIVFCLPGLNYSRNFLTSWTMLIAACVKEGHEFIVSQQYSSVVHFARAKCLGADALRGVKQLPFDGQLDYDYIMWIDSDMVFDPKQFLELLKSPHDITAGLYSLESGRHFATVEKYDMDYFKQNGMFKFLSYEDYKMYKEADPSGNNRYLQVDYTGMGWMLIKKGVIEDMKYPWFYRQPVSYRDASGNTICDMVSEDVAFCLNAKATGYDVYVDTNIIVGHEKPIIL